MTLNELSGPGNRSLLLVHGRDFKPAEHDFMDLSMAALRAGIERDYPEMLDAFAAVNKSLAWYGDLNAEVLQRRGKTYDENLDLGDRRNALTSLRAIDARKKFGIRQYDCLPGKTALPEAVADVVAPLVGSIGLVVPLVSTVSKDFARYLDHKADFAMQARERLRTKLCELLDRGDRVVLLAHGTGGAVAWDVLWQLSHDPDLKQEYADKKIEIFLTMGSPLGDRSIRNRLLGSREKPEAKYPANIISWHNVSAEDDYTCHDNTLADDFKAMMKRKLVSVVQDHHVFNLAIRYGKSNPHSSVGYLIHPRISKILADWLRSEHTESSPKYTF
jgi:hypothetical protein